MHVSMLVYVYECVHVCMLVCVWESMLVCAVFANTIAVTSCEGKVVSDYDVWSALGPCCAPLSKSIFSVSLCLGNNLFPLCQDMWINNVGRKRTP